MRGQMAAHARGARQRQRQRRPTVKITFIRKDADSQQGSCPALYMTDRGTFVVQGKLITDPEALGGVRDLADDETVVEVPANVLAEIAQRYL
jgi:hypothetical protein